MARRRRERRTDQELLVAAMGDEPAAFTVFYERHVDLVLAYLRRRTSSAEVAADLMAETFAAALLALHEHTSAAAARQRLGLEPLVLDDRDLALVDELSETDVVRALADLLPPDQLEAIRLRIIDERDYDAIARHLGCSEAVVRKRVSRGLATLRARVEPMP